MKGAMEQKAQAKCDSDLGLARQRPPPSLSIANNSMPGSKNSSGDWSNRKTIFRENQPGTPFPCQPSYQVLIYVIKGSKGPNARRFYRVPHEELGDISGVGLNTLEREHQLYQRSVK